MGPETENVHMLPISKGQMMRVSAYDYDTFIDVPIYSGDKRKDGKNYARLSIRVASATFRQVGFHRFIMGEPIGLQIDHINGDTLDNRRENLRACSVSQNSMNRRRKATSKSPYKGVTWDKHKNAWKAILRHKHLGNFSTPEQAKEVHDTAAREAYGEFFNDGKSK